MPGCGLHHDDARAVRDDVVQLRAIRVRSVAAA
jgi:hypothetical protein